MSLTQMPGSAARPENIGPVTIVLERLPRRGAAERFRVWAERFFDVQRWTEMPSGGHFAAMEEPEKLVEDIRAFFRPLRTRLSS